MFDRATDYQVVRPSADSTDASYPSRVATTTMPSGDGVVSTGWLGGKVFTSGLAVFYGTGSDDNTFKCQVLGWNKIGSQWLPILLAEVTATLSTLTGVAGQTPDNTYKLADILSVTNGVGVVYQGTSNVNVAALAFDLQGCQLVEFIFNLNSAPPMPMPW